MKKLTETQQRLLAELPDDEWKFPGSLQEQSYRKLESMGFAESELMMAKRNNVKGTTEFRIQHDPLYFLTARDK
jgi:hypothetical protein